MCVPQTPVKVGPGAPTWLRVCLQSDTPPHLKPTTAEGLHYMSLCCLKPPQDDGRVFPDIRLYERAASTVSISFYCSRVLVWIQIIHISLRLVIIPRCCNAPSGQP